MIRLQLFALSGVKFDEDVYEVMVPTVAGDIAIYGGHAPLLGAVAPGVLSIRKKKSDPDQAREHVAVYGGAVEVLNNAVKVLVDEVDTPDSVVEAEAEKALARATEMKDKAKDEMTLAEAQSMIDRQAVRLKLAELKKHSKKRY